ncbi:TPA: hypothetical protein ACV8DA_005785, partial [Escherichia coli]
SEKFTEYKKDLFLTDCYFLKIFSAPFAFRVRRMAGYGMVGLQPQGDDCNTSDHHSQSSVNVKYLTVQSVDYCRSYGIFVKKILHGESP